MTKLKRYNCSIGRLKNGVSIYFVLAISFFAISCDGQDRDLAGSYEQKPQVSVQTISKVVSPEFGFNSGLLDSKGILWFGSNGNGIYRFDGSTFTNITVADGLCNNQVYSMIEGQEGDLLLGTADGMCRYDGESFVHVPIPFSDTSSVWLDKVYPIISPNAVHALLQDKSGTIWIGTAGAGAYRFDGKNFTSYLSEIGRKQEDSLHHNWIPSIEEDADGNIWFASMTHGGVSRFDGENFTHFMPKDGLTDDMVRKISKDSEGKLWFGYNGNRESGLSYYNGSSFVNYYLEDGLCNPRVRAFYEDGNGLLYLGADLGNLCTYNGKSFKEFKTPDGRTISNIISIVEDAKGNIWFLGRDGLLRFDGHSVSDMKKYFYIK